MALMNDDPTHKALPAWQRRSSRFGVGIMIGGFLVTVLFGGERAWAPWPPMVIIIIGFDLYIASAIWTSKHRIRAFAALRISNKHPVQRSIGT